MARKVIRTYGLELHCTPPLPLISFPSLSCPALPYGAPEVSPKNRQARRLTEPPENFLSRMQSAHIDNKSNGNDTERNISGELEQERVKKARNMLRASEGCPGHSGHTPRAAKSVQLLVQCVPWKRPHNQNHCHNLSVCKRINELSCPPPSLRLPLNFSLPVGVGLAALTGAFSRSGTASETLHCLMVYDVYEGV
jgi:hypothetical protein